MYIDIDKMRDESRVWVFQADRKLTMQELTSIKSMSQEFTQQWTAHNAQLLSSVAVYHNFFLVISVDEDSASASGCSIDAMTRFIKEVGSRFGINFFDRSKVVVERNQNVDIIEFDTAAELAKDDPSLLVFDNLIADIKELRTDWRKRFVESWHAKLV